MKHKNKPLAAFEKIFWLLDQTSQVHFVVAAEISGTATLEEWRSALDAVQQRHPLLSVYIESDGYKNPYFKHAPGVKIPLKVIEGDPLSDWKRAMENEMAEPFDWTQGPLVRAVLIREGQKSIFILSGHHSIGDGVSISFVIRDILRKLSGATLENLPMPLSTDDLLDLTLNTTETEQYNGKNRSLFQRRKESTPDIKLLKLSPELTKSIAERARLEGTTVQGALCAALTRSYRQISVNRKEEPLRVVVPISLRNILNAGESISLCITSRNINFDQKDETPFWDIARYTTNELKQSLTPEAVKTNMTAMRQNAFGDLDIQLFSEVLQQSIARDMMITNLGQVSYETTFGSLKLEAIWPLACSGYEGEHTISIVTVNGSMCLSVASRSPFDNLLTIAKNELSAACI